MYKVTKWANGIWYFTEDSFKGNQTMMDFECRVEPDNRRIECLRGLVLLEGFQCFTQTQTFSLLFTSVNGTLRGASSHALSQVGSPTKGHGGPISGTGNHPVQSFDPDSILWLQPALSW